LKARSSVSPIGQPRCHAFIAARDAAGQEIYTWTAMLIRSILCPEEKLDFRSRFVSPPENAIDVMVRFSHAQDAAPATK
jgi:hypothetical protein